MGDPEEFPSHESLSAGDAVISVQEEEVYLWPRALLGGAERDRLDAGVRKELENHPPRFGEV